MGEPLLTSDEDYDAVIAAITEATSEYDGRRDSHLLHGPRNRS